MGEYIEPTKIMARYLVINEAVKTLTSERETATLTRRSYVNEVKSHILNSDNPYDICQVKQLSDETILRWETFYDSIVQKKSANNLKVAYLSGPNPENDLKVFCEAGVLPENIWAFESDNKTYNQATISALSSEFPFIKIINSGIDSFIEASPQKFDIIYLDFCAPLPSRSQKTLSVITKLLAKHSLNSPGILITNVSLPNNDQDIKGRDLLSKLVASYLYPKGFLEADSIEHNLTDGAIAHSFEFDKWLIEVKEHLNNYYGQFITRLLMDHLSVISPYDRFPQNSPIYKKYFKERNDNGVDLLSLVSKIFHFDVQGDGGDVIIDSNMYPILWSFATLHQKINQKDYPELIYQDEEFKNFAELFLRQLSVKNEASDVVQNISNLSMLLLGRDYEEFLSESLKKIITEHRIFDYYQFCDLLLSHQILELLFRQVAIPYQVNVEKTKRWTYQAKKTLMYMDMTVVDECRYVYDWMPTADMFTAGISNIERQLIYRFALDGMSKHRRWYNNEYFFGTAVVDQWTEGFEAKKLTPREHLNNYFNPSATINFDHPSVAAKAIELAEGCNNEIEIVKRCFEFVRDKIHHTGDMEEGMTTCSASEVLENGTGWCYAKSHLLAALLRANNIATALCYQRLSCSEDVEEVYCLHGLNAVYLKNFGWYRIDARGNKSGVNAEFDPPNEKLAFELGENEYDLAGLYAEPLDIILKALKTHKNYNEMIGNFPDLSE